jgi:hypothetical protein
MDRTADLEAALHFVVGRIEEQAVLSGEPLSDERRLLLDYLPTSMEVAWDPESATPIPRNIDYEQVCALARPHISMTSSEVRYRWIGNLHRRSFSSSVTLCLVCSNRPV